MELQRRTLSQHRALALIEEDMAHDSEATTVCLEPGATAGAPEPFRPAVADSDTGAMLFLGRDRSHALIPPFPVSGQDPVHGWDTGPLRDLVDRPRVIAVLLLRLGGFAVGIYERRTLVSSKVGSRFVKGRHAKGGSSQARFARRREEQARALYGKACEVLHAQVQAWPGRIDHFLVGGDRRTLQAFEGACGHIGALEAVRLRRLLRVGDPRHETLKRLPTQLYECVLISAVSGQDEGHEP